MEGGSDAFLDTVISMSETNHFDERAKSWDDDPIKADRATAVADGIRARVPLSPRMRALEYGCGTGLLSFALRPQLGEITLADSSEGMLAVLREKLTATGAAEMYPIKLDLAADPIPQERYDLIYSLMTFHHIEDIDRILGDLHAMLNSPGWLCVADLDAEDGSFHGPEFRVHKGFDRDDLGDKARRAEFRSVEFTTVYTTTRSDSAGQTEFPIFLLVAEK